jgi:predicted dienelactone hydrolase
MRVLEVALLLSIIPVLGWYVLTRNPPSWLRFVPALSLLLLVVHAMVEGQRWQMWPAYIVAIWLFLACSWHRIPSPGIWTSMFGFSFVLCAAAAATVLPVFDFPAPTGPFPVGTMTLHLVDESREETQSSRPGEHRELMIQLWYPAQYPGPTRSFRDSSETSFRQTRLALVKTHASSGVPLANAIPRFPVLIFCPSWQGSRDQNTFQTEELASYGFVVAGIDHPYATELTAFPDGRRIGTALGEWIDFSTGEAFEAAVRRANIQLDIRTADARFALDELERLNKCDAAGLFMDRLDTARVGIFGHSFGGAVAMEACRLDSRFAAGINLDGCIFGRAAEAGVRQPFLFMSDDTPIPSAETLAVSNKSQQRRWRFLTQDLSNIRHSLATYGGYYMTVRGTRHMNFSDSPLSTPLKQRTGAGPIPVTRAMRVINAYTLAFFNQFLRNQPQLLLDGPSAEYPEVEFEVWRAGDSQQVNKTSR